MVVNIKLSGEGLSFEGETDLFSASQVIAFLNRTKGGDQAPITTDSLSLTMNSVVPKSSGTPREALMKSGAKTNSEKITALVAYISERDGGEYASVQDIQGAFKKAGEPLPRNFSRDLKDAIAAGFIYESEVANNYAMSEMGIEAIGSKFEKKGNIVRSRKNKPLNPAGIVKEEVKKLEVTPVYEGLVDFASLNTKGKKILWLIAYAANKGIETLNPSDIQYMGNALRESLLVSSFTSLTEKIVKDGLIYRSGDGYKISGKGLEVLKLSN